MKPQAALAALTACRDLSREDMLDLMRQIMRGDVTPVMTAALVTALRMKGETVDEITAAAMVMRELSAKVTPRHTQHLVDTCGTGGDGAHTFNISTAAAFVTAAAGARVAKHGGRAVSSQSGSADVLESLGVNIQLTAPQVGQCIDEVGLGFMFAPNHHSAMKHAVPVRKELGIRTIFNVLGPLTNPAGAPNQVMGVFHPDLVDTQCQVLRALGSRHALVVHGLEGLDELSISGESLVGELAGGVVRQFHLSPEDLGLRIHNLESIKASDTASSQALLLGALENTHMAARDIVALNAGASIYVSGLTPSLSDGVARALDAINSGAARTKLDELVTFSQSLGAAA